MSDSIPICEQCKGEMILVDDKIIFCPKCNYTEPISGHCVWRDSDAAAKKEAENR